MTRTNVSLENISSLLELLISYFSLSLYTQKLCSNQLFELGKKREVDIVKFTTMRSPLVLNNIFPKKDVDWSHNYLSSAVLASVKSVFEKKQWLIFASTFILIISNSAGSLKTAFFWCKLETTFSWLNRNFLIFLDWDHCDTKYEFSMHMFRNNG
jgi:hypothetical protein